ncbi:hypothetical protein CI41S_48460 [Bradyrhizobium ivorense]|nr:hypothetical protein CI41S_48460 [Bradyrhizobium ivorense]
MNRNTCWPVATSISPESTPAFLMPSTKADVVVPAPSAPKLLTTVKLSAKFADALIARLVSSTTSASAAAVAVTVTLGPSSRKVRCDPTSVLALAVWLLLSVTVPVSVIRPDGSEIPSLKSPGVPSCTARRSVSVTRPDASTETVNTRSPPTAVRPSTTPPALTDSRTCWPVAESIKPESAFGALTDSAKVSDCWPPGALIANGTSTDDTVAPAGPSPEPATPPLVAAVRKLSSTTICGTTPAEMVRSGAVCSSTKPVGGGLARPGSSSWGAS